MLPYRYAPRPTSDCTVVRKDLLRNLTEATLLKQLSLVRGPAGSGKTTLLSQWRGVARDMGRHVGWLTVDKADRDPTRLVRGLAVAIEQAGCPTIAEGFRQLPTSELANQPVELAQRLASICNKAATHLVIVLDQYEEADIRELGDMLSGFLGHAANIRFVIASRKRLHLPLASLRARDQIFEIAPSALNLTLVETHELFPGVPELYTRRLHYETSGEAVAVGFARRVMETSERDVLSSDSWQDQLYEFYHSEVLDALAPDIREAMSRLVAVERFDLSLASALIGRNAIELIEQLHRVEGILLKHRGSQEFYFSEMLRRFLETRLGWLVDEEHRALHSRAAAWFARRGRHAEALRHAVEADERDHARELLERVGYANLVVQHGVSAAHELLEAVGVEPEGAPVGHHLSLALIHAHEGDHAGAARHIAEARHSVLDDAVPSEIGPFTLVEAVITGMRDDTQNADTAPALVRFLEEAPTSDHEDRAQAHVYLSWDMFCRGDIAGAERLIESAEREYGDSDGIYGAVFMHVHRVLYRYWLNDLDRALEEITLADQASRIFFPNDQRLCAMVSMIRAGLLFELGRADPLTDMTALTGTVGAFEPWPEIQIWSHSYGAKAAFAQGSASEARGIIAYGSEVSKRLNLPRLDWALKLLDLDIALKLEEVDRAQSMAELLAIDDREHFTQLPTFLTWQERIGAAFAAARLAEAQRDYDGASDMLDVAAQAIAETSATRFAIKLEIARARLCHSQGDADGAARGFTRARMLCKNGLPMQLFLDGGDGLRIWQPDFSFTMTKVQEPHSSAVEPRTALDDPLTVRERQILMLLGEGHQNKVTAHRLGLSEATVKFHLRNIYRKLKAQNRTQALARYRMLPHSRRG